MLYVRLESCDWIWKKQEVCFELVKRKKKRSVFQTVSGIWALTWIYDSPYSDDVTVPLCWELRTTARKRTMGTTMQKLFHISPLNLAFKLLFSKKSGTKRLRHVHIELQCKACQGHWGHTVLMSSPLLFVCVCVRKRKKTATGNKETFFYITAWLNSQF